MEIHLKLPALPTSDVVIVCCHLRFTISVQCPLSQTVSVAHHISKGPTKGPALSLPSPSSTQPGL